MRLNVKHPRPLLTLILVPFEFTTHWSQNKS